METEEEKLALTAENSDPAVDLSEDSKQEGKSTYTVEEAIDKLGYGPFQVKLMFVIGLAWEVLACTIVVFSGGLLSTFAPNYFWIMAFSTVVGLGMGGVAQWFSSHFVIYGIALITTEMFSRVDLCRGINTEGVHTAEEAPSDTSHCKQLDYEDYGNYFIVMSGDLLGLVFIFFMVDKIGRKMVQFVAFLGSAIFLAALFICTRRPDFHYCLNSALYCEDRTQIRFRR
ncbi:Synaptic vesicle 2-related protein [Stylophora pistillata]|uniref:Synaptic vesicle 2-related protein n=1 Tax=Stylophora pistillata TaxID=50429 RepID=A0A2B4S9W0_STYPI|nr:Synaptic vesicle 2-related protein [Stylophora pistillata]